MDDPDRMVRVGDLVGAAEIAVRLGLKHPQSVSLLKRRHADFPEPIMQLAKAFVVELARHRRLGQGHRPPHRRLRPPQGGRAQAGTSSGMPAVLGVAGVKVCGGGGGTATAGGQSSAL